MKRNTICIVAALLLVLVRVACAQPPTGTGMNLTNAASAGGPFITYQTPTNPALPGARVLFALDYMHSDTYMNYGTDSMKSVGFAGGVQAFGLKSMSDLVVIRQEFLHSAALALGGGGVAIPGLFGGRGGIQPIGSGNTGSHVQGDAANAGVLNFNHNGANTTGAFFNPQRTGYVSMRYAQRGTAAGTRRCGWANAELSAVPTNGVWMEHTNAGSYTLRVRVASVDTVSSSFLASAANGAFHTITFQFNGASGGVEGYVDGAMTIQLAGISLPNTGLGFNCYGGSIAANEGLTLKYLDLRWQRE